MAEGPSLTEKLAAIREAQGQKVAKVAEEAKIEEAHGEALEEDKAREAISEAQVETEKKDALRAELNILEVDFVSAKEESLDAEKAIVEAGEMLADLGLDAETQKAIKAVVEKARLDISKFKKLNERKEALEAEIAALGQAPAEGGIPEKQEGAQESAGLENKIGSAGDMKSLLEVLGSVDYVSNSSGEKISTQKMIKEIENMAYMAPEMMKKIFGSEEQIDAYLAATGVTRALGIRDKVKEIILDIEAMTAGFEAPVAEVAPVAEAPKVESAQESAEAGLKARIESATNIEAMANALRQVEFVKTTLGEKAKSSDMIATIRELYYMPSDISGDFASDDIDKYLMNRGVTSELGIRGKAVELIAAEFSHRLESAAAEKIRKQTEIDADHAEALKEDEVRESPEPMRRKELVEEIREKRAEEAAREKLSTESRRIKVYTEKGQGMTLEEAKAKKAEIGEVDIIMNRSNINALMEAGLLSPEDVVNQIFKPYYEKHESFEECRKRLSILPKEVIRKLDLGNRKYEKDISELIKDGMEQAYGRGSVIDRAYAFFQLPDLGSLNTGALAFSGLEPGNGEWTKARDSMVGLFDGENKGSLLIATTGDLPELMFNSVDLGWLNREQIVKWIKDSNEAARGLDNESRVISKTLELQEKGYISAEEAEELLK